VDSVALSDKFLAGTGALHRPPRPAAQSQCIGTILRGYGHRDVGWPVYVYTPNEISGWNVETGNGSNATGLNSLLWILDLHQDFLSNRDKLQNDTQGF